METIHSCGFILDKNTYFSNIKIQGNSYKVANRSVVTSEEQLVSGLATRSLASRSGAVFIAL